MDAKSANREKMQWLNAISLECEVPPTAFRVAFLIADHHNRVAGCAWPSRARLAGKICLSNRSIQRSVVLLEKLGWITVDRRRDRSNRYKMNWPPGRKPPPQKGEGQDKIVRCEGHQRPSGGDKTVRQSYLRNYPKTFSSRPGRGKVEKRFSEQGKYETEIIARFGPDMIEVLETLDEADPTTVEQLCRTAQAGTLTSSDIDAARLAAAQWRRSQR